MRTRVFFFFRKKGPEGEEHRYEIVCPRGGFIVYAKEDAKDDDAWEALQKSFEESSLKELKEIFKLTATAVVEIPEH